jgi:hypothetical protein
VGLGLGLGLVTPGDVLAYRTAWNQYVLDTVRVANNCASAYTALAAKETDPSTKAILTGLSKTTQTQSDSLLAAWNIYANMTSADIVINGSTILQSYQQTVVSASKVRDNVTTGTLHCSLVYTDSSGVHQAIAGVDPNVQAQIIARIEGLGILASGILQILVATTTNTLSAVGSAAQWTAKQASNLTSALSTPWPWVAVIVGAGAFALWELRR